MHCRNYTENVSHVLCEEIYYNVLSLKLRQALEAKKNCLSIGIE